MQLRGASASSLARNANESLTLDFILSLPAAWSKSSLRLMLLFSVLMIKLHLAVTQIRPLMSIHRVFRVARDLSICCHRQVSIQLINDIQRQTDFQHHREGSDLLLCHLVFLGLFLQSSSCLLGIDVVIPATDSE